MQTELAITQPTEVAQGAFAGIMMSTTDTLLSLALISSAGAAGVVIGMVLNKLMGIEEDGIVNPNVLPVVGAVAMMLAAATYVYE